MLRTGKDKYSTKESQGTSLGKDAVCSVCKQKKDEIYGFAIPWTFHTFDKPGFIAGGFNVNESWKNTPVCFDCATRLENGDRRDIPRGSCLGTLTFLEALPLVPASGPAWIFLDFGRAPVHRGRHALLRPEQNPTCTPA